VIYLLHFEEPIGDLDNPHGQAQHYLGFAEDHRLDARIDEHRTGRGAAITRALHRQGIRFVVAAIWPGDRNEERRLKRWHKHRQLCPICRGEITHEEAPDPALMYVRAELEAMT
jgi:predicted GIY-YIG superfamily endonuclease